MTLIQLGEYALAVGCWLILAIIWVSKAFAWKGEWGRPRRNTFLKVSNVILALVTCIVLITWTNIKRQDDYWTALQKLWTHYRLNIFTVATNKEYAPGTVIGGIVWRPVYTELDLIVNNPTDGNYDDVNILVRPDYPVAKIAQLSNLSDVCNHCWI